MSNSTQVVSFDEAAEMDGMAASFADSLVPRNAREQAIYNRAYILGRRSYAAEQAKAPA